MLTEPNGISSSAIPRLRRYERITGFVLEPAQLIDPAGVKIQCIGGQHHILYGNGGIGKIIAIVFLFATTIRILYFII